MSSPPSPNSRSASPQIVSPVAALGTDASDLSQSEKGIRREVSQNLHLVSRIVQERWARIDAAYVTPAKELWLYSIDNRPITCIFATIMIILVSAPTVLCLSAVAFGATIVVAGVGSGVLLTLFGLTAAASIVVAVFFFLACVFSATITFPFLGIVYLYRLPRTLMRRLRGGSIQLPPSPSVTELPLPGSTATRNGTQVVEHVLQLSHVTSRVLRMTGSGVRHIVYVSASGLASWAGNTASDGSDGVRLQDDLERDAVLWTAPMSVEGEENMDADPAITGAASPILSESTVKS